jgi:hypothetical protein
MLVSVALACFLVYFVATRQSRRALMAHFYILVGDLLSIAGLKALAHYGQATLPVYEDGDLAHSPQVAFAEHWANTLLLIVVVWAGGLARLQ